MEPTDTHQANERTTIRVETQALDAVRIPLTVILAQAQLLERRMLQGHALTPDDVLAALSAVQRSGWDPGGNCGCCSGATSGSRLVTTDLPAPIRSLET